MLQIPLLIGSSLCKVLRMNSDVIVPLNMMLLLLSIAADVT